MSLRVRRVEAEADFHALAATWDDLAARSGQTSPFLSHDWFACCWPAVGPSRRPEVLVVEASEHFRRGKLIVEKLPH